MKKQLLVGLFAVAALATAGTAKGYRDPLPFLASSKELKSKSSNQELVDKFSYRIKTAKPKEERKFMRSFKREALANNNVYRPAKETKARKRQAEELTRAFDTESI